MIKSHILDYHATGVFKNASSKVTGLNMYDFCNSPTDSKAFLEQIRMGINYFFSTMGSNNETSVLTKYTDGMYQTQPGSGTWYSEMHEDLIVGIYQSLLFDNYSSTTLTNRVPLLDRAMMAAADMAHSWCCAFWRRDPNRTPVSNHAPDYIESSYMAKGQAVELKYKQVIGWLNNGGSFNLDAALYRRQSVELKDKLLASVVTLDSFIGEADSKKLEIPESKMDEMRNFDPDVISRLEVVDSAEAERLSKQAQGKSLVKSSASLLKLNSSDENNKTPHVTMTPGMDSSPIISEEQEMHLNTQQPPLQLHSQQQPAQYNAPNQYAPQPQSMALVDFRNQPILNANGQTISVDMSMMPQGSIYQEIDEYNRLMFDNEGYPLVACKMTNGQEAKIALTNNQTNYRNMLEQQKNAPAPAANTSIYGQQSAVVNPQPVVSNPTIPGLEMAASAMQPVVQNPAEPVIAGLEMVSSGVSMDKMFDGVTANKQTPEQEAEPSKHFDIVLENGEACKAVLVADEKYFATDTATLNLNYSESSHLLAVAYTDNGDIEILINEEKFMNRDMHLPYYLRASEGEFTAKSTREEIQTETAETPIPVMMTATDKLIEVTNYSELITTAMCEQTCNTSGIELMNFTVEELLPSAPLDEDVLECPDSKDWADGTHGLLTCASLSNVGPHNVYLYSTLSKRLAAYTCEILQYRLSKTSTAGLTNFFESVGDVIEFMREEGMYQEFIGFFDREYKNLFCMSLVDMQNDVEEGEEHKEKLLLAHSVSGKVFSMPEYLEELSPGNLNPSANKNVYDAVWTAFEKSDFEETYIYMVDGLGKLNRFFIGDRAMQEVIVS